MGSANCSLMRICTFCDMPLAIEYTCGHCQRRCIMCKICYFKAGWTNVLFSDNVVLDIDRVCIKEYSLIDD